MLKLMRLLAVVALVVASCGGEGDAGNDESGDPGATETTSTTTTATSTSTTTTVSSGGGSGDEWCQAAENTVADVELNPLTQTPEEFQATVEQVASGISNAAADAPDEIVDDVQLFADAYKDLVEFFAEYEWNFLAIPEDALDDPRLTRLDEADFEQAGNNIEAYCGFEFVEPGPGEDDLGAGPGTGGLPGAEIPEGFPTELVPPNGTVLAAINVGSALSVSWDVDASLEDLVAFYTDVLGSPTATAADSALWVTTYNGFGTNVALQETGPGTVNMNVTYGQ